MFVLFCQGPKHVGKTRFMEECVIKTPNTIPIETVTLRPEDSGVIPKYNTCLFIYLRGKVARPPPGQLSGVAAENLTERSVVR